MTNLTAYERWMVRSNLETIRTTDVTAAEQVATLRANGYERVATAVQRAAEADAYDEAYGERDAEIARKGEGLR